VNHKHRAVISSYSDLLKLSSGIKIVHFRKFVSKRILKIVLEECSDLKVISLSKYASKRLNSNILKLILSKNIELIILFDKGRPNNLKQRLYYYNVVL